MTMYKIKGNDIDVLTMGSIVKPEVVSFRNRSLFFFSSQ